ncbi:MAG: hypothetical protein SOT70_06280 [Lachnospiraceae bacterium]|nr:hypothetical protein [Lachnospiraceae bacterium]
MYYYTMAQWVLFFYLYCMIGWIWESCYVSLKEKKWTNRGFMHGPFLPIYGSGAVVILLATIPVKDHLVLIFLFGMIAATALEYVTGEIMEALFHVRYWDYSDKPFNVKGHICLLSSVTWGFFSILMVKVIHVPIADLVQKIPTAATEGMVFILTIIIVSDFSISFREAMDLGRMLENLAENNEEFKRITKRLEVRAAFAEEDVEHAKQMVGKQVEKAREDVTKQVEKAREDVSKRVEKVREEMADYMEKAKECASLSKEEMLFRKEELIHSIKERYSGRPLRRSQRILRGNHIVAGEKFEEALELLKEMKKDHK